MDLTDPGFGFRVSRLGFVRSIRLLTRDPEL